ncbi:MAG: hypothetical protein R3D85_06125 [Paracoccaceae bacterium]
MRNFLIVGAGTVGRSMREAYACDLPGGRVHGLEPLARRRAGDGGQYPGMKVAEDLEAAVGAAEVICCATMASEPVIEGAGCGSGQHLDLIGAYRPDMREVDDEAMRRARVFVDSYATTLEHIGELIFPLQSGALKREEIVADYYDLGAFRRQSEDEITIAKNGGGAHLDLMTSRYVLEAWRAGS